MADIPIIFSAPMILALLDGRKTMTRRLAWKETTLAQPQLQKIGGRSVLAWTNRIPSPWQRVKPGDRLWVRETWRTADDLDDAPPRDLTRHAPILCEVDYEEMKLHGPWGKVRPSIFMPRWASRLTLIVTATKIERLQDISDTDALREGIRRKAITLTHNDKSTETVVGFHHREPEEIGYCLDAVHAFRLLWNDLHGLKAWDDNPEVVPMTFTVNQHNIDAMPKAAA